MQENRLSCGAGGRFDAGCPIGFHSRHFNEAYGAAATPARLHSELGEFQWGHPERKEKVAVPKYRPTTPALFCNNIGGQGGSCRLWQATSPLSLESVS